MSQFFDKQRPTGSNALALLRRVPDFGLLLVLILVAGVAEGFGLTLLIPVVFSLTNNGGGELPTPFNLLPEVLVQIGLPAGFLPILSLTLITMLISFTMIHFQERFAARSRYIFLRQIRDHIGEAVFRTRWERFSGLSTGDVVNQVLVEAERGVEAHYSLIQMVATLMQLTVYLVFALLLSWEMSLVAMLIISGSVISGRRLIRRTKQLGQRATLLNDRYSSQLVDYLKAGKLLKISGAEDNVRVRLADSNYLSTETQRSIIVSQATMRFELQAMVSIAVVMILYLSVEVLGIEVSVLLVFMYIVMRLAPRFSSFQTHYHIFSAFGPAIDKVNGQIEDSRAAAEDLNPGGVPFVCIHDAIEFVGVRYCYPNSDRDVLKGIDMRIPAGKMVALVGPSGGGKSTALDLLIGLNIPTSGHVTVDGWDLRTVDQRSYRRHVGFVPQESSLFSGTIRENLTLFEAVDEARLWRALELAQIAEFVRSQSSGLDSAVGEAGIKLSGGQRQRLSIARALVREPALVILDEATSALDSESELRFQQAIEQVAGLFTMVVVAHRLSTVRKADWIYVMRDGQVAEQGDYATLAANGGAFAAMLNAQELVQ
jgi:ABC-type multidrug transport system fused ATPase/permease subunit